MGLVTQVDVEQGDFKVKFMFPIGPRKTIDQKLKVHAMCQSKTLFVRYLLLPQQLDELIRDEEYDMTISACQYLNMAK